MPIRRAGWFFMICPLLCAYTAQAAPSEVPRSLTIEADIWCPINCAPGAEQAGIGIELAKKIFEPLGYKINYNVVPWTQALRDIHSGKADAIMGASVNDDPTLKFPTSYITRISDDFYVLDGSRWRYQGEYTLKDKKLAVVSGYGYSTVVANYIKQNSSRMGMVQQSSGNDALMQNIALLKAAKVDMIVESRTVMDYTLQKKGITQIVWAGGVEQGPVYLAFNPASPDAANLAHQYDAGIAKLRASGELDRIYRSYGLKP